MTSAFPEAQSGGGRAANRLSCAIRFGGRYSSPLAGRPPLFILTPMQAPTFRARSVPELLDAAFQVLRARYLQLVTAALVISFPAFVLGLVLPPDAARLGAIVHNFLLMY